MTAALITRCCGDCGAEFQTKTGRFCPSCAYKPTRGRTRPAKYLWTPERDQILRDRYDGARGRAVQRARALCLPKWVVVKRAALLGLTQPKDRRDWTQDETRFLVEHLGVRTPKWIALRLKRSETSVVMRAKRLRLSRAIDVGSYSARELGEGFGIDSHKVERWIRNGLLRAERSHEANHGGPHMSWSISREAVRDFIRENPAAFDIRRVDQLWFLDVLEVLAA